MIYLYLYLCVCACVRGPMVVVRVLRESTKKIFIYFRFAYFCLFVWGECVCVYGLSVSGGPRICGVFCVGMKVGKGWIY